MSVAVVIVNWNSGELLQECLNRLLKQTMLPQHVIVVDNASLDDSAACVVSLPGINLLQMTSNFGFAAGNNRALTECDTEFVALLNPDAFPEPDWLERLVTAAKDNSECAFFGSRMLVGRESSRLDGTADVYHISGAHWRRSHRLTAEGRDIESEEIFAPCAAAALYRRDVFLDAGGFDESYFCYSEDIDLGFRMRLLGHRCLYVSDAVVHHIGSATTGGQHSDFSVYHGHRNLVWTYFKDMPWPLFWLYLPQHLLLNLLSLVWFTLRGQGRVIFKAKLHALKGLPRILQERRKVQATRRVSSWELRKMMVKGLLTPYLKRRI